MKGGPVPERLPVSLFVAVVVLLRGYGVPDDAVDSRVAEKEAVGKDPVIVEGDPVPRILFVPPTPTEVELLKG